MEILERTACASEAHRFTRGALKPAFFTCLAESPDQPAGMLVPSRWPRTAALSLGLVCLGSLTRCESKVPDIERAPAKFDAAYLASAKWAGPERGYGWALDFQAGSDANRGRYQENFEGEGCGGYEGNFTISPDKTTLTLTPDPGAECNPWPAGPPVPRSCRLESHADTIFLSVAMNCGTGFVYWKQDSAVPEGTPRTVAGMAVLTAGMRAAQTTSDLKIRAAPDKDAASFTCAFGEPPEEVRSIPFIPRGHDLLVLARTPEKQKVDQWEDYWYYVRPVTGWYEPGCEPSSGWVFGEFVRFTP